MRRPLVLPIVALLAVACSDANRSPTSLGGTRILTDENPLPKTGSCIGDPSDPATAADYDAWKDANIESPCDAAANLRNADHQPGTEGFYLLPPIVGSVPISADRLAGMEDFLVVELWPVGGSCLAPTAAGTGCAPVKDQHPKPVTLADGTTAYQYQWKGYNKGPTASRVPPESYWLAWITLEWPDEPEYAELDDIYLGYREFLLTESPNATQPANGETRDENYGRNININFTLAGLGGCTGAAGTTVQCVINFAEGGDLTVGQTTVSFGPQTGLGVGVATVTDNCSLDLDIPVLPGSPCLTLDLAPVPPEGTELTDTYAFFCGIDASVAETGALYQQSQGFGTWALPPVSDAGICPDPLAEEGSGFERLFSKLASAFGLGPKPLVATLLSHSTRGGGMSFCCSQFEFRRSSTMAAVDPTTNAALPTQQHSAGRIGPRLQAAEGEVKTVALKVVDHDGLPVEGATVHGFTDNGSVTPASFTTGLDGIATFDLTIGPVDTRFWALGCGIGIEGSSAALTPDNRPGGISFQAAGIAKDEVPFDPAYPDVIATCDRDPADTDTNLDADGSVRNRGANGPLASTDPFIAPDDQIDANCPGGDCSALRVPVAIDDVPIEYLFEVCGKPTVNGEKDLADGEWSERCTDYVDFTANTTGKADPGNATLRWTIVNGVLYGAIEIRDAAAKDLNDAFFYLDLDATSANGSAGDSYPEDLEFGDDVVVMRLDEAPVAKDHFVPLTCEGSPKASLCSVVDSGADPNQAFGAAKSGVDADGDKVLDDLFWEFSKSLVDPGVDCGEDLCLGDLDWVGISATITGGKGGGKGGTNVPADGGFILMDLQ